MVDFFNDYFINVVSNLIVNVPMINSNPLSYVQLVPKTFFFPISSFDIQKIICTLKDKPCNLSNIPAKVTKSISYNLSEILSFIFNNCIEQGVYPDKMKQARVIPIFKLRRKLILGVIDQSVHFFYNKLNY